MPNLCRARARLRPERPAPMIATSLGGEEAIFGNTERQENGCFFPDKKCKSFAITLLTCDCQFARKDHY